MRRFLIEKIVSTGETLSITGAEARHMTRVLRLGPGDRIILMDPQGARFTGIIKSTSGSRVRVHVESPLPKPPPSPVAIILCQAVLKSRPMDFMIQKASELGVDRIIPFFSARTVVRLDEKRQAARMRRWKEVARSSAKQADRRTPAAIDPLRPFTDLISGFRDKKGIKVILWEREDSVDMKGLFREGGGRPEDALFIGVVGPEGGFTPGEVRIAEETGFIPASLGTRILRAETAAVTLTALVQYEWGDLGLPASATIDGLLSNR